jgi:hypothetical protein
MKENDKNIEDLIDKMMSENTLETPSIDFTSKIMSQVAIIEENKIKVYKPLISKQIWILIVVSLIGVAVYASLFSGSENDLIIGTAYSERISAFLSGIHISKNILYSILVLPFMILIQIGVLKNYFDKKYQV